MPSAIPYDTGAPSADITYRCQLDYLTARWCVTVHTPQEPYLLVQATGNSVSYSASLLAFDNRIDATLTLLAMRGVDRKPLYIRALVTNNDNTPKDEAMPPDDPKSC